MAGIMAEARRNRTNPSTLPRRRNGFEDRGSHQTPFASPVCRQQEQTGMDSNLLSAVCRPLLENQCGGSVRNPTFCAPASCATSIAATARSNGT